MKLHTTFLSAVLVLGGLFFSCTGERTGAADGVNPANPADPGNLEQLYRRLPKIDAHTHLRTNDTAILRVAGVEGFRYLSICTRSESQARIDTQLVYASRLARMDPGRVAYLTAFSMDGFGEPGWAGRVMERLQADFNRGAIGIKVWKDIGMTFRDSLGRFIFLDDTRFDPLFAFLQKSGKPVLAHIGEPRNCWLPIDSMTVNSDREYYKGHPQYHMYLQPDAPSHERLMESRDHVLARFPGLKVIGAHLGSLEWDVDTLAGRLDRFPNFAVDMAARVCHLQVQDRDKVRNFIIRYQDRLIYGTDLSVAGKMTPTITEHWRREWQDDWAYFATGDSLSSPRVNESFRGLELSEEVLRKIYYSNALHWYPGLFQ